MTGLANGGWRFWGFRDGSTVSSSSSFAYALIMGATAFIHSNSPFLHATVRFLIFFASVRIFDVIFEVLTDLVQSHPSLDKKEVWYVTCIDLLRYSVPISFARKSDLRTPKYGTL